MRVNPGVLPEFAGGLCHSSFTFIVKGSVESTHTFIHSQHTNTQTVTPSKNFTPRTHHTRFILMLATCDAYRAHRHGSESPHPGSTPGLIPCNHLARQARSHTVTFKFTRHPAAPHRAPQGLASGLASGTGAGSGKKTPRDTRDTRTHGHTDHTGRKANLQPHNHPDPQTAQQCKT